MGKFNGSLPIFEMTLYMSVIGELLDDPIINVKIKC